MCLVEHLNLGEKFIFERHYQKLSAIDRKNSHVDTDTCLFSDRCEGRYNQGNPCCHQSRKEMKQKIAGKLFFHIVNSPTSAWMN